MVAKLVISPFLGDWYDCHILLEIVKLSFSSSQLLWLFFLEILWRQKTRWGYLFCIKLQVVVACCTFGSSTGDHSCCMIMIMPLLGTCCHKNKLIDHREHIATERLIFVHLIIHKTLVGTASNADRRGSRLLINLLYMKLVSDFWAKKSSHYNWPYMWIKDHSCWW